MMTQLVISIRSQQECATALQTGANIIDIKDPTLGSLGAADVDVIRRIVAQVDRRRPVSIALGELREFDARRFAELPTVEYVKLGLAGCAGWPLWPETWLEAWQQLPGQAHRVAVAYADADLARCPHWSDVLECGRACGCSVLLVDTHDKSAGGLLDWVDRAELQRIRQATLASGLQLALAGSLTRTQIGELLSLVPDFVAVRGAVCHGYRIDSLSRVCVDQIVSDLGHFEAQR
jgi:uncharacterized protein (UPF0264 family)